MKECAMRKESEIKLEKIKVGLITDYHDRAEMETLLSRYHPLGAKKALGRRLSYSASYDGEWLGVLLFDAAVKSNKHREERIGWSKEQREGRLVHIANNSRYLLSARASGTANVASKILSLVTARISADWQRRYGIPLLAVETYVDPERNENSGTCYTAAGWEKLGYSSGYQAYGEERTHSKWYFLKGLHKDSFRALSSDIPHALLTGIKEVSGRSNNNYVLDASKFDMQSLQRELRAIKDPRKKQGQRYAFVPLLSLCIAAVVSGYTQYRQIADWIRKLPGPDRVRFGLRGDRVPEESTISHFLRKIDPVELQRVLSAWLLKTYQKEVNFNTVCMDGKVQRATSSDASEQRAFFNVFASELGIVIEHQPTQKGGGEKITAREVLRSDIDLAGKTVVADALHTDRELLEELKKKELRMSSLLKEIKRL
jgi:hypothetical protein